MFRKLVLSVVAAFGFAASSAEAQFVLPSDLMDKMRVVGISEWEFKKTPANAQQEQHYMLRMKVRFENTSNYNVVFREPAFTMNLRKEGEEVFAGQVKQTPPGSEKGVEVQTTHQNLEGRIAQITPARLPNEADIKLFNLLPANERHDALDARAIATDIVIAAAGKDGKATEVEHNFVVDCGPVGVETTDKVLLSWFNTIAGKDAFTTLIDGSTKVGVRGMSGATVFSSGPIDIQIPGKPQVKFNIIP